MAKTEDIEGRLAAYIDGELDANQRAEIEKHLAEHPKHRALIHELIVQKDLLKALPRQAAPADLAEAFTAQLERAVLLGDVDANAAHPPMRIGFFQQFRTVAAVLLLTAGLAALILSLLPRRDENSPLADLRVLPMPPETAVTLEREAAPESVISNDALADSAIGSGAETLRLDNPAAATVAPPIPAEVDAATAPTAVASVSPVAGDTTLLSMRPEPSIPELNNNGTVGNSIFQTMVDDQQPFSSPSSGAEVVTVIRTDDVADANRQVTAYLDSNQIKWEMQPMPAPLGLGQQQTAMASRLQTQTVEVKAPSAVPEPSGGFGDGSGRGAEPTTQNRPNEWLVSNAKMAGAAGDNRLVQDELPQSQRIIARVPRRQANEVVSHLNQLKSSGQMSRSIPLLDHSNRLDIAAGFGNLNQIQVLPAPSVVQSPESMRQLPFQTFGAVPGTAPTTFPSSLQLVPTDPFSFFNPTRQQPLILLTPTTQVAEGQAESREVVSEITTQLPEELVDVVIVLESQSATAPPTSEPTTLPAE